MSLTSVIQAYNTEWPRMFATEAEGLRRIFGEALLRLHHVGSTAVPGLAAKPEIDILAVVTSSNALSAWTPSLADRGYGRGGDLSPGHHFFKRDVAGVRTHKLHLCVDGHPDEREKLRFRDHLRGHSADRDTYGAFKLALEADNKTGIAEYLQQKAPFIQAIMAQIGEQESR
ncbi:GrpB family protein [Sphingomonas sp. AR_OL41]|uniref:GrpB family protein n=1 Tax=Sphingomonas sp. AR_OL41 TaxID=3042729 RepID=UPI0024813618|nr:GrpB family protein [Sphingomonas sp. AR_OL41]MDH7973334.1 GrpB family protein [Sphingomonas sp. AR_OL41]